jgi:hypothetical protein
VDDVTTPWNAPMKMKNYELRMCPEVMKKLRVLSLRLAYERGREESWASLVREGVDLLLKTHAQAQAGAAAPVAAVTDGGDR